MASNDGFIKRFFVIRLYRGKGAPADTGDPEPGKDGETAKKIITVTFRDDGIGENGAFYKWLKEVSASYPDKSVEIKPTPIQASEGDYFAKVALALKSKDTAPDIVTEDTFILNSDASAGYLEPLDDKLAGWEDWGNGSFIEAMKKGLLPAMARFMAYRTIRTPGASGTIRTFSNRQVFRRIGALRTGRRS